MVNEFGALPIDASLVEAADERIVSLVGGCVCCSYGEDLVSSLAMLAGAGAEAGACAAGGKRRRLPRRHCRHGRPAHGLRAGRRGRAGRRRDRARPGRRPLYRQHRPAAIGAKPTSSCSTNATWRATRMPWKPGWARRRRTRGCCARCSPTRPSTSCWARWTGRAASPAGGRPFDHTGGYVTATLDPPAGAEPEALARILADPAHGLLRAKGFMRRPDGEMAAIQTVGSRWTVSDAPADAPAGLICIGLEGCTDMAALRQAIGCP